RTAARISLETRQISFTPGAFVGVMKTRAKFFPCTGISPWWATNVKWVSAEPVATTFAPETWMPASVSFTTRAYTSVGPPGAPGVVLVGRVELRVGPQRGEERGLVVRRPPEPAVGDAGPRRDGIPRRHLLLHRGGGSEVAMGEAAPLRRHREHAGRATVVLVERVVQAGQHAGHVLERGMPGD